MSWYNPISWFAAGRAGVESIEAKAESAVLSLEREAGDLVTGFQAFATSAADKLAKIKTALETDIAAKQAALDAVNGELAKAQSVVPAPVKPPLVQTAP